MLTNSTVKDIESKKSGFDFLQICLDYNKSTSSYTTECNITSQIFDALSSGDEALLIKALKFVSSIFCFINNKNYTDFLSVEAFGEIFKCKNKGTAIRREVVYFLCNISTFDIPVIKKFITIGYFTVINELFKEVHSFTKGLLLSALWAIFIKARCKGYTIERDLTKEYLKVGGMEIIKELEKSPHKSIKERVLNFFNIGHTI